MADLESSTENPPVAPSPVAPEIGRGLKLTVAAAALIGGLGVLYVVAGSLAKPNAGAGLRALAVGAMGKLQMPAEPTSAPPVAFTGPEGRPAHLSDFRGKVVVLNLWATWCTPCVKEMPTLAKLQATYAGRPVQVVALSQDRAEATEAAKRFIAKQRPLPFYQDAAFGVMPALKLPAAGFPTTVIYDRQGVERAYLQGDADWSSPEAKAVIDRLLAEPAAPA